MQDTEESSTIQVQYDRWISFLDQWEMAICSGREILVLGDFNTNFLTWTNNNAPMTSHTYKLRSLTAALFDHIKPHGFVQLINVATRVVTGCEPSGLDHVYSNHPEHLSEAQVLYWGSSDHKLVLVTRYTKSVVRKQRYVLKRCYKNFRIDQFLSELKKLTWLDVYL